MKNYIKIFFLLFIFWIGLSGRLETKFIIMGAISSMGVALLCTRFLYIENEHGRFFMLAAPLKRLIPYSIWLTKEIAVSAFQVALIVIKPKIKIEPEIITFKWKYDNPTAGVVLINSITLTPGTLSVQEDDNVYTVHALTKEAKEALLSYEMQRRVSKLFGEDYKGE